MMLGKGPDLLVYRQSSRRLPAVTVHGNGSSSRRDGERERERERESQRWSHLLCQALPGTLQDAATACDQYNGSLPRSRTESVLHDDAAGSRIRSLEGRFTASNTGERKRLCTS